MMPHHHPKDEWLLSYAAGTLDEAFSLLVASHLTYCAECRERVREAELIGGALLADMPAEPVADGSLDKILARLDDPEEQTAGDSIRVTHSDRTGLLPGPLGEFIGGDIDSLPWKFAGPGVRAVRLPSRGRDDGRLWLLRARPGTRLPEHSHNGSELTLVIKGAYSVGGATFAAGDVEDVDNEHWHQPRVDGNDECICVVATDAPLKLRGFVSRLLQPVIGL